jgi:hypothetical protein
VIVFTPAARLPAGTTTWLRNAFSPLKAAIVEPFAVNTIVPVGGAPALGAVSNNVIGSEVSELIEELAGVTLRDGTALTTVRAVTALVLAL